MARTRSPLEPAATYVHVFLWLSVTAVGLSIVGTIFGGGSVFGIGSRDACVEMANGTVPVPQTENNIVMGARDGVRSGPSVVRMCMDNPTAVQRLLHTLTMLPTFLVVIGALLLAAWSIRVASREGIFTVHMAKRLRMLGWFVLAGELGATLLEALARGWLANTMLIEPKNWVMLSEWDLPALALFLGAVLISMARIMRISTEMREDLEGTV